MIFGTLLLTINITVILVREDMFVVSLDIWHLRIIVLSHINHVTLVST
jgi:hypothetical protein